MTKIANKAKCNIIESGYMDGGSFLGDLLVCPTYEEIIGIDKFNVAGTYENNQLVKESDITKYTGQTINHCIVWGEYSITFDDTQFVTQSYTIPINFHATLLHSPDVPIKISITYYLNYIKLNDSSTNKQTRGTATITINNPTANGGVFGATVSKSQLFGSADNSQLLFNEIYIDSISISPVSATTTSSYNYVVENKGMTKYKNTLLDIQSASLSLSNYNNDSTNKIESNTATLTINFNNPTDTGLSSGVSVYLENMNYSDGYSNRPSYTSNSITYTFGTGDNYGARGYKLSYYKLNIRIYNSSSDQTLFLYTIFNPRTNQTGIELASITDETEPITEE